MNAQVRIERYADQGRCVGHIDGRVVFVRFALPGELVQVALMNRTTATTATGPARSSRSSNRAPIVWIPHGRWPGRLPWVVASVAPIWCT